MTGVFEAMLETLAAVVERSLHGPLRLPDAEPTIAQASRLLDAACRANSRIVHIAVRRVACSIAAMRAVR